MKDNVTLLGVINAKKKEKHLLEKNIEICETPVMGGTGGSADMSNEQRNQLNMLDMAIELVR